MSLRILYHHRIRADDGQAVHVRELIEALRHRGHEVQECALVQKTNATAASAKGKASFWQRLSLPRAAVEVLEVAYNRRARSMLRDAAAKLRPHLVYERHALHCRAGLDVARELSVPLLLEVNSPMADEMEKLGLLRLPRRARATERLVLTSADRVLAVTEVLGSRLVQLGARKEAIRVIGNGAEPGRYDLAARSAGDAIRRRWNLPEDAVVVGFVGYMRPWHRLELVLSLMQRPQFRHLHLVLLGDGPALSGLVQQAASASLQSRMHVLGTVPSSLVPAHVCAFDVALIPAINDYASPLKLFDSLAAGVATIAPNQANLREVVTHGVHALLFEPGEIESLAQNLLQLVEDSALRQRLGAAGESLLRQRNYTWDGNAARVEAIAAELLLGVGT
jgi:glycosyltransferase involved in cell wall biosynthesis